MSIPFILWIATTHEAAAKPTVAVNAAAVKADVLPLVGARRSSDVATADSCSDIINPSQKLRGIRSGLPAA
jgi:hypothetical protein